VPRLQMVRRGLHSGPAGHLFRSETVSEGPFVENPKNFLALDQAGGVYFTRLWGENYHHLPGEIWLTNQWWATDIDDEIEPKSVYAAPIKSLIVQSDGVARAMWYPPNDSLRSEIVDVCEVECLETGVFIEEEGTGGILIELESGDGWMVRFNTEKKVFEHGMKTANGEDDWVGNVTVANYGDFLSLEEYSDVEDSWRAIVRTGFKGRTMVEFYQNGVLATPWTLPSGATGKFEDGNGGEVIVFRMML